MSGCGLVGVGCGDTQFYDIPGGCDVPRMTPEALFGPTGLPLPEDVERHFYREGNESLGDAAFATVLKSIVSLPVGQRAMADAFKPDDFGAAHLSGPLRIPGQRDVRQGNFRLHVTPADLAENEARGGIVKRAEVWHLSASGKKVVDCPNQIVATWPGAVQAAVARRLAPNNDQDEGYRILGDLCQTPEGVVKLTKMILGEDSVIDIDLAQLKVGSVSAEQAAAEMSAEAAFREVEKNLPEGFRRFGMVWSPRPLPRDDNFPTSTHLYTIDDVKPVRQQLRLVGPDGEHYKNTPIDRVLERDPYGPPTHPHLIIGVWGGVPKPLASR